MQSGNVKRQSVRKSLLDNQASKNLSNQILMETDQKTTIKSNEAATETIDTSLSIDNKLPKNIMKTEINTNAPKSTLKAVPSVEVKETLPVNRKASDFRPPSILPTKPLTPVKPAETKSEITTAQSITEAVETKKNHSNNLYIKKAANKNTPVQQMTVNQLVNFRNQLKKTQNIND